jgi:hypothetical protein
MNEIAYRPPFVSRNEISQEFTISVSMEFDGNERQLLGSMELNGQDFYDELEPEERYGRSCIIGSLALTE